MPIASLKQQLSALPARDHDTALRPLLQGILDALQAVATKLDADATVTDTDYRATVDALVVD